MINPSGPPSQSLPPHIALGTILIEVKVVTMTFNGITVTADVADRDNQYCTTTITANFERLPLEDDADLLRRGLKILVCHEVDEQIKCNGFRVFDPHNPANVERHY